MQRLGEMDPAELERAILRSAELGGTAFKAKDYKAALGYDTLKYVSLWDRFYDTSVSGQIYLNRQDTLLRSALSNRSACHLALGDHLMAFTDASDCEFSFGTSLCMLNRCLVDLYMPH